MRVNGVRFGALAWGEEGAPLALALHGFPDTAWTWRHLGPRLAADGWRVVAPFTRGYGPTDLAPDGSYRIRALAADALALEAELRGSGPSVLLGHDWGGVTTYAVTAAEPGRFAAHVTLAIPPAAALLQVWLRRSTLGIAARQAPKSWYFLWNQLPGAERSMGRVIPKLWRDWSPGYDGREDAARALESLSGPGRMSAGLRYYRQNLTVGALEAFGTRPGAPVLYLHGADDGCVDADVSAATTDVLAPGSRFEVLPGVGHFPQLEDPGGVHALLAPWLQDAAA